MYIHKLIFMPKQRKRLRLNDLTANYTMVLEDIYKISEWKE